MERKKYVTCINISFVDMEKVSEKVKWDKLMNILREGWSETYIWNQKATLRQTARQNGLN